jgi:hypothetical protein
MLLIALIIVWVCVCVHARAGPKGRVQSLAAGEVSVRPLRQRCGHTELLLCPRSWHVLKLVALADICPTGTNPEDREKMGCDNVGKKDCGTIAGVGFTQDLNLSCVNETKPTDNITCTMHRVWSGEWSYGAMTACKVIADEYEMAGQADLAADLRKDAASMRLAGERVPQRSNMLCDTSYRISLVIPNTVSFGLLNTFAAAHTTVNAPRKRVGMTEVGGLNNADYDGGILYANRRFFIPWGWCERLAFNMEHCRPCQAYIHTDIHTYIHCRDV